MTDLQVANVFGRPDGTIYSNNRLGFELLVRELLVRIGFTLALSGMGTALCLMIFCQFQATRRREQRDLLTSLGMRRGWRRWLSVMDSLVPALAAMGVVTLGLCGFNNWQVYAKNKPLGMETSIRFRVGIDVSWYGVICVIYLAVVLGTALVSGRRSK